MRACKQRGGRKGFFRTQGLLGLGRKKGRGWERGRGGDTLTFRRVEGGGGESFIQPSHEGAFLVADSDGCSVVLCYADFANGAWKVHF